MIELTMADPNFHNVLAFPQTAEALGLDEAGTDAMGLVSLLLMDRQGEPIPRNVRRLDALDQVGLPCRSPELLLALLLWSALPERKRERIRGAVRGAAYAEGADQSAVHLHNLLSGWQ